MSGDYFTEKQLRAMLKDQYQCRCIGKELPLPYLTEDEMPDWFVTPTGHHFCLPLPPDGAGYKSWMVELIKESAKLDVVVVLEKKSDKKAEISEE